MRFKSLFVLCLVVFFAPSAHADVVDSIRALKDVLLDQILPIFALMGLGFSAFGFFTGNPNAKQHLAYAITGAAIVFGAQSIMDLIARLMR